MVEDSLKIGDRLRRRHFHFWKPEYYISDITYITPTHQLDAREIP
jgi:hypothetical protein